ncbi:hypothetical protein [Acidianus brierleyi]|uniref:Uncharacterized protein n=1 Tax=Acidianus brierleyi TaxID=41673 RepID=A0A2U9IEZ5_9CREN|nr:hypothetical protein [Acidianus brierleyi]AWR94546.1 hypothetical protein DFR85_08000 [Acidianus brierleyi]
MSETKLNIYAKLIVNFEKDIKNVKSEIANDTKNLILLSQNLSQQFNSVAESSLKEISKSIDEEKNSEISKIRQKYSEDREQKLQQIKYNAEKNFEKAVSEVLSALSGAFK